MAFYRVSLLLLLSQCMIVWGVTLSPCGSDQKAEVRQGTTTTFKCSDVSSGQQVQWFQDWGSHEWIVGTCTSSSTGSGCNRGEFGAAFTPSRRSPTESSMVIDPTKLNNKNVVGAGTLICSDTTSNRENSCQTDYIVAAEGTCTAQLGTGPSRYEVQASCSIQFGASSSRNRYRCEWYRNDGSIPSLRWNKTLKSSSYQTDCVVTDPLPTSTGRYTYTATLIPGRNVYDAGTVDVTKPTAPNATNCGKGNYIPENTTVHCTCTTANIGQPAGRLQWVRTDTSTNVTSGNYGDRSLTVSQILQRSDHEATAFHCKVDWAIDILGAEVKFKVGYPPTTVSLRLSNAKDNQTVNEYWNTTFRCENSDGQPTPTMTLVNKNSISVLASGKGSLNHIVTARCEDSGPYVCKADNGMGSSATSGTRSLFVRCSPRGQYDVGDVNFISGPVSTTFDVTAFPVPNQVTFHYLVPMTNDTGTVTVQDSEIHLTGQCQPKPGVVYLSTCTVTVLNITTATAAGFYQVTVTNTQGRGRFRLQVKYRAPEPEPGTGDGGSHTGAIVGGVIGSLAVIAVIVAVVFFVITQRKDSDKQKLHTSAAAAASNGAHAGHHGEFDNPALDTDPEQPQPSTSTTAPVMDPPPPSSSSSPDAAQPPAQLYAVVNKPKKTEAAAAAAPEAVYAEVDKNKKKKKDAAPVVSKSKPPAKPRKEKNKKGAESHIYDNVDTKADKKGKKPTALPMEQTKEITGREINQDGLLYTSVDFTGVTPSPPPPPNPPSIEQAVIYSAVNFAKAAHSQE